MQIRFLFRFNHGAISIFEIREREGRMYVWNQVDAAPSNRRFVSIGNLGRATDSMICSNSSRSLISCSLVVVMLLEAQELVSGSLWCGNSQVLAI
jgi:hypothetical protein